MTRLVSRIYSLGEPERPSAHEVEERANNARRLIWKQAGLAVFDPEDIRDEWFRQAVINEAEKLYGRRGRHDKT